MFFSRLDLDLDPVHTCDFLSRDFPAQPRHATKLRVQLRMLQPQQLCLGAMSKNMTATCSEYDVVWLAKRHVLLDTTTYILIVCAICCWCNMRRNVKLNQREIHLSLSQKSFS